MKKELHDLTIGEAKKRLDETLAEHLELCSLFGRPSGVENPNEIMAPSITGSVVGKYVIVRSRNEGLNAGTVIMADDTGIVLDGARRLWYHRPAVKTESWYEGVCNHGVSKDTKLSSEVARKIIIEDYSVTVCSEKAELSIKSAVSHAQN